MSNLEGKSRLILYTQWGPVIRHKGNFLHVSQINPEWETRWVLTRWEMISMAWRLFVAALRTKEGE